jgi:hypothetical protein
MMSCWYLEIDHGEKDLQNCKEIASSQDEALRA